MRATDRKRARCDRHGCSVRYRQSKIAETSAVNSSARKVALGANEPFEHPDYQCLIRAFAHAHPDEFEKWKRIEKDLFESRRGRSGYPDQPLMKLWLDFIKESSLDGFKGYPSRAWMVLRGHILRAVLDENPNLRPDPRKILITEPRTCSDNDLTLLVARFRQQHPNLWTDWCRIEASGDFDDDPLGEISVAFYRFLQECCWVQSLTAFSCIFLDARRLARMQDGQFRPRTTSVH